MIFDKKKRTRAACALLLLFLLTVFAGCGASLTSLRAFAKPCTGEYDCIYAHLGKKDLLASLQSMTLTLEEDGTFSAAESTGDSENHTYVNFFPPSVIRTCENTATQRDKLIGNRDC